MIALMRKTTLNQEIETNAALGFSEIRIEHKKRVLADRLSFKLKRGDCLTIYGPARSGKSSLLLVGAGLVRPKRGQATVLGEPSHTRWGRSQTGIMGPLQPLYPFLSLKENLALEARLRNVGEGRIESLLKDFSIAPFGHLRPHQVPETLQVRTRIACAVVHNPVVAFLDEPTLTLGEESDEIWQLLENLKQEGMALVVSTRQRSESAYGDTTIELPWEENR